MEDLSKKERTMQKREALIKELYSLFIQSYEMDRAWGMPQNKAFERAFKLLNNRVKIMIETKPQEKTLIMLAKTKATELIHIRIKELENRK